MVQVSGYSQHRGKRGSKRKRLVSIKGYPRKKRKKKRGPLRREVRTVKLVRYRDANGMYVTRKQTKISR